MATIACTTWEGGGNVAVFRALAAQLRDRGHEVELQIAWNRPPLLDGDLLLLDHMTQVEGFRAALGSGRPVATVVHTLWSYVPSLVGTWAPEGYLDLLAEIPTTLVFSIPELDQVALPATAHHVGPVFEPAPATADWQRPDPERPLVVVSLGTTDMGEADVLQRVLDGLADLDVAVLATVGPHIDPGSLRVPGNATVARFVSHRLVLPEAAVFVGHGGHGGIMASLAAGTPVVSIPLGRDQNHNAAKVAATGTGATVDRDADAATVAATVAGALDDDAMRAHARRLAGAIDGYRGEPVRRIEELLP